MAITSNKVSLEYVGLTGNEKVFNNSAFKRIVQSFEENAFAFYLYVKKYRANISLSHVTISCLFFICFFALGVSLLLITMKNNNN